jgi:hypothetical protein
VLLVLVLVLLLLLLLLATLVRSKLASHTELYS